MYVGKKTGFIFILLKFTHPIYYFQENIHMVKVLKIVDRFNII